jgi:hypothetical protein
MSSGPIKRHDLDRPASEVEITRFEMQRIFKGDEEGLARLMSYLSCRCDAPGRHIVNYTVHVSRLNDLVLRGTCSACGGPAGRYLETGEDPEKVTRIKAVLKERRRRPA